MRLPYFHDKAMEKDAKRWASKGFEVRMYLTRFDEDNPYMLIIGSGPEPGGTWEKIDPRGTSINNDHLDGRLRS